VKAPNLYRVGSAGPNHRNPEESTMWTKPEAEIVAVTMEVTAYVATL
jgi:coenzyme PQQ precursor peptide PqqA